MSLHPPAPVTLSWLAEHSHKIQFAVARGRFVLQLIEYLLQAHDGRRLRVPALTQPTGQQRLREQTLRTRHFLERQSLASSRNKMPVVLLGIAELKRRLGLLFRR